jgi:hypothetical protein
MALNTTFTSGNVLTAAQMNNLPWGVAGKAQNTSDFILSSTSAAVPNTTVTWTAVSTRLYKITVYCYFEVSSGTGVVAAQIFNVGTGVRVQEGGTYASALSYPSVHLSLYESGLSGTQTRRINSLFFGGGITAAKCIGNANFPTTIIVEDIGLA